MEDKILRLFRKNPDGYLSGEEMSKGLDITRSAVWKHIEKLRCLGYEFDAVPHLGYRLRRSPDRLYAFEISPLLKTAILGKKILYYNELDSTNTTAYALAQKGACEGTVVIAEKQHKGKGRLARKWVSPKGRGLYCSVILKPPMTPFQAPVITLMAAVSIAQAIRDTAHIHALIKWPNDIILNNKKTAGILTEMDAEADRIKFIILGMGININARRTELPACATSLARETDAQFSRAELLVSMLERLEANYTVIKKTGFLSIRPEWLRLSATLGKRVRAECMHRITEGVAVDIDDDGALKIRLDNGFHERISAGDVTVLR